MGFIAGEFEHDLLAEIEDEFLRTLLSNLYREHLFSTQLLSQILTVNPNSSKLTLGARMIISSPICSAIELLREQGDAHFSQLLRSAFGIARYESEIHQLKIYNLIARIKSCLPNGIKLITRSERAFLLGNCDHIVIKTERIHTRILRASPHWDQILAFLSEHKKSPESVFEEFKNKIGHRFSGGEISRMELERTLKLSRASAHRLISLWVRNRLLTKNGVGKKTTYAFVPQSIQ